MRRILFIVTILGAVATAGSPLDGQTSSTSLTVNATVSKNCTIVTAPVTFGAYDPVAANATAPLDATGTVTVTCTKGAPAKVGLGLGSNALGTVRRMSQSATAFLNYELYRDSGHATVWGDDITSALDVPPAPDRNPRSYTIYARVIAGQDATVGTYTDTVVATVNF